MIEIQNVQLIMELYKNYSIICYFNQINTN